MWILYMTSKISYVGKDTKTGNRTAYQWKKEEPHNNSYFRPCCLYANANRNTKQAFARETESRDIKFTNAHTLLEDSDKTLGNNDSRVTVAILTATSFDFPTYQYSMNTEGRKKLSYYFFAFILTATTYAVGRNVKWRVKQNRNFYCTCELHIAESTRRVYFPSCFHFPKTSLFTGSLFIHFPKRKGRKFYAQRYLMMSNFGGSFGTTSTFKVK